MKCVCERGGREERRERDRKGKRKGERKGKRRKVGGRKWGIMRAHVGLG